MILTLLLNLLYSRKLVTLPGFGADEEDETQEKEDLSPPLVLPARYKVSNMSNSLPRRPFRNAGSRYRSKHRDLASSRRTHRAHRSSRLRQSTQQARFRKEPEITPPIERHPKIQKEDKEYMTIACLRAMSDKLGAISMLLFIVNLIMASLTHTLRFCRIDALLVTVLLELCWQISESMFLFGTFFGLFRMFLSWIKSYNNKFMTFFLFTILIVVLVPLSYLFVGIEEHRWIATLKSTKHVLKEAFWDFAIWVRHLVWGKDSNFHWTWLGTELDWFNRPNPTKLVGFI